MIKGVLTKMLTQFSDEIKYFLDFENEFLILNQLINKKIEIDLIGFQCLNCKSDSEIFRQGFCKKCFFEIPKAGDWIMKPELSKAHLNIEDRDLEYEKKIQLQPHCIYLALSSHIKVGVTRKSQIPFRWIDQGAHEAVVIATVPNRYLSGMGEVALKNSFSDKTNWRKMLQNEYEKVDWYKMIETAKKSFPNELKNFFESNVNSPLKINYPVLKYPTKVKTLNLKKEKSYKGILKGIKGQYLIFDDQTVFNVRSNEGLVVNFKIH